ncbi:hypothetical protein ACFQ4C_27455 [Larkinella insperata]|uniref:Uncharacterized protein n=1 Tax=Larkinella insperata TaxID=332158 RepID=A0ABW3QE93_9BACT|nr:hypothetical protein [Larkinella insperata]
MSPTFWSVGPRFVVAHPDFRNGRTKKLNASTVWQSAIAMRPVAKGGSAKRPVSGRLTHRVCMTTDLFNYSSF